MNLYGRALAVVGVVFAGAAALACLALAAGGGGLAVTVSDALQTLVASLVWRVVLAGVGVVFLFAVAYFIMRALGIGASKVLSFESSSGHMEVDISAIEECLRRTALEIDDVVDARARIHIQPGGLAKPILCNIQVGLRERSDVPGKGSEVGARVKERFLDIIPIDTAPLVNLSIRIRAGKKPLSASETGSAADAEEISEEIGEEITEEDEQELEDAADFIGERDYTADGEERASE